MSYYFYIIYLTVMLENNRPGRLLNQTFIKFLEIFARHLFGALRYNNIEW